MLNPPAVRTAFHRKETTETLLERAAKFERREDFHMVLADSMLTSCRSGSPNRYNQ